MNQNSQTPKTKKILFVCTGNSCRSVIAEGLMKKRLKELAKDGAVEVSSAGISATDGGKPTENTIKVMQEEGIDLTDFKSRFLTQELTLEADTILVMEQMHKNYILSKTPRVARKIHMVKEFALKGNGVKISDFDIDDPLGRPIEVYRFVKNMIKDYVYKIADKL